MDEIEAAVHMPAGTHSLTQYRRYYNENERVVAGIYVFGEKPGREWQEGKIPIIAFHGGCDIVNVAYSELDQKITFIECNDTLE